MHRPQEEGKVLLSPTSLVLLISPCWPAGRDESRDARLLLESSHALQVWTNTCCSHPLHGQEHSEVDEVAATASGAVPGAIAAAIRKLQHELGIPAAQLHPEAFVFLTRLHYCAGDVSFDTGEPTGWGEHEMDYILFVRASVSLDPNPDEIDETKYVTPSELKAMMSAEAGLRWSPWFRIIASHFLPRWWADLDGVFAGKHADWASIHKLAC